jgi:hypothetical protein
MKININKLAENTKNIKKIRDIKTQIKSMKKYILQK